MKLRLLILLLIPVFLGACSSNNLRVISYNVWVGYTTKPTMPSGQTRKEAIYEWLNQQQPDIVGFQELNGYSEEQLLKEAAAWGHHYAATNKTNGYIVGITSRYPMEIIEKRVKGMHHGLVHVRTAGVDVVVTHFSPFQWKVRNKEAAIVSKKVELAVAEGRPVIVMGDLNARSPQDAPWITQNYIQRKKQRDDRDDRVQNLENGAVSYTCLQTLLDCGLHDVCVPWRKETDVKNHSRIDYILATDDLAQTVRKATWQVDEKFRHYSDHYPVVADFMWP